MSQARRCGRAEHWCVHGSPNPKDGNCEATPCPIRHGAPGSLLVCEPCGTSLPTPRRSWLLRLLQNPKPGHKQNEPAPPIPKRLTFTLSEGWRRFCRRRTRLTRLKLFKSACSSANRGFGDAKSPETPSRSLSPKSPKPHMLTMSKQPVLMLGL